MATTGTVSSGPRYAPEDPTLPKPWRGLVDSKTGYLYFWNTETNVTQYERPSAVPIRSLPALLSSSIQVQTSLEGQIHGTSPDRDRNRREWGSSDVSGLVDGSRDNQMQQNARDAATGAQNTVKGVVSGGYGASSTGSSLSADAYRQHHEITVHGDKVPPPLMSFDDNCFPPEILREVHHAGFTDPTPIQAQSWPIALEGRDIVAIAKTGSGKTLGYLIPGFIHLNKTHNDLRMGPTVLVLSPTRELATQIQDEAVKFGKSSKISCTCLYGGAPKGPQLRDIDRGVHIVIATPGRLNDILEMRRISLMQVSYLVLDEADRMLDMGFEPQIRKIVNEVPSRRQTLMYTATWPKEVRKIAADLLVNPIQVNIGNVDELVANKSITQHVEVLSPLDKHRRLEQILQSQEPGSKIIIFCSTKRMCDQLARNLARHVGAAAIHGDKSQSERDSVLNQFRTGKSPVLVATDVAARGLDVKDVRVVINYDFPTGVEDYVHRIGRTGRAGASGVAYTFFGDQDARYASDLIKILEGADQKVPAEIRSMATRGGGRFRRWGGDGGGGGGTGGRGDSGYGGRGPWSGSYGGRDGGRPQSGGNGRGSDSYRYGSNSNGYENVRSRSRSPVARESSYRGSWHNRDRSRSRSAERYDQNCSPVRSFHQTMMKR